MIQTGKLKGTTIAFRSSRDATVEFFESTIQTLKVHFKKWQNDHILFEI